VDSRLRHAGMITDKNSHLRLSSAGHSDSSQRAAPDLTGGIQKVLKTLDSSFRENDDFMWELKHNISQPKC